MIIKNVKPSAVMSAYNKVNGFHASENKYLIKGKKGYLLFKTHELQKRLIYKLKMKNSGFVLEGNMDDELKTICSYFVKRKAQQLNLMK